MSRVAGSGSLLEWGSVVGSFNRSSIIERCKALDSLASLSFLRLAGFENQNTVSTASELSVALFSPNPFTKLETKTCSVKWWLQTWALLSYIGGSSNCRLFSHYRHDYLCNYVNIKKNSHLFLTGKAYLMASDENLYSQEHLAYNYHSHTQCKRPAFLPQT